MANEKKKVRSTGVDTPIWIENAITVRGTTSAKRKSQEESSSGEQKKERK